MLQKIPENLTAGYADVDVAAEPSEIGDLYSYRFTGVAPTVVLHFVRARNSLAPIEKKPGVLVIQRFNSFTERGGLLPMGLYVDAWAEDVPADLILRALNDLEAMTPKVGIPQEVRREILPGAGKAPKMTLDLHCVDPLKLRDLLETELAKAKP